MNKINTLFISLLLFTLSVFITTKVYSSHVMGSDMSWKCIGKDSFIIDLIIYRDCNGTPMASLTANVLCKTTGALITSLVLLPGSAVDITPSCKASCTRCQTSNCSFPYGIEKYDYHGLLVVTAAGSCCEINITVLTGSRNSAITSGAAIENLFTYAIINRCLSPCDNFPKWTTDGTFIQCVGQDFYASLGAKDTSYLNGYNDSFRFEWAYPLQGSGIPTSWNNSYDSNKFIRYYGFPVASLAFPRGLHLDSLTGDLTFRPMIIEQTIATLKVSKYRNHVKISEVRRELEFIVTNCTTNHPPTIKPANYNKQVCPGDTVRYHFTSSDIDPADTVLITWNKGIKGAKWSDSNGKAQFPSADFEWIPGKTDFSSTPHSFKVTVKDNACPIKGSYTHEFQVLVIPVPQVIIDLKELCAGNFMFTAIPDSGNSPVFKWTRSTLPDTFNYTGAVFNYHFASPGLYLFSLNVSKGNCQKIYKDSVRVRKMMTATLPIDTIVCPGTPVLINGKYANNTGKVKLSWNLFPGNTNDKVTIKTNQDTTLIFTAIDSNGCKASDTMKILMKEGLVVKVKNPLSFCLESNTILYLNNYVKIRGISKPVTWSSPDKGFSAPDLFNSSLSGFGKFPAKFSYYDSLSGCLYSDSILIQLGHKPDIKINKLPDLCETGSPIELNPYVTVDGIFKTGTWTATGSGLFKPDWFDPKSSGWGTFKLKFSFMDTLSGCQNSDSTMINVGVLAKVKILNISAVCDNFPVINLYYYGTVDGNLTAGIWTSSSPGFTRPVYFNPKLAGTGLSKVKFSFPATPPGCRNEDSINILVNPAPHVYFYADPLSGHIPLQVGFHDSSSLSSGTISNYFWDFGDLSNSAFRNPVHVYLMGGLYTVKLRLTSDKLCVDSFNRINYISANTNSIRSATGKINISISPNPASHWFYIELINSNTSISSITMINSFGQEIRYLENINSDHIKIETLNVDPGLYILMIQLSDGNVVYREMMIEKTERR